MPVVDAILASEFRVSEPPMAIDGTETPPKFSSCDLNEFVFRGISVPKVAEVGAERRISGPKST